MDYSVALERIQRVRDRFPEKGLFAQKEWLISPQPFLISAQFADELERLGHRLLKFVKASNLLYHLSVKGKQPPWIAAYLDAGKPAELVDISRRYRYEIPRVIRPDIILTDDGYEHQGKKYKSLSPIACEITGTHWSGPAFFGTAKKGTKK